MHWMESFELPDVNSSMAHVEEKHDLKDKEGKEMQTPPDYAVKVTLVSAIMSWVSCVTYY